MSVMYSRDGPVAYCPEEPPQADPVALRDEDCCFQALDMAGIGKAVAAALSVTGASPSPILPHAWHIGGVSVPPGKELPVYLALPMGRASHADVARTILVRGRSASVLLVPHGVDEETRLLLEDSGGAVFSLAEIASGVPGPGAPSLKPLSVILAGTCAASEPEYMFRKEGRNWRLRWSGGPVAGFSGTHGFRHILILLENPYVDYSALELRRLIGRVADAPMPGMAIKVAGDTRIAEWRIELEDNQRELDEAERDGDKARMDRLKANRDRLVQHIKEIFGMGGRSRTVADAAKNAKDSVIKAINVVHKCLRDEGLTEMSAYLRQTIRTGRSLCYHPPHPIRWNL